MARKKLTVATSRNLAQIMLNSPRRIFREPATPTELQHEIDPDELLHRNDLRWFDCPAYDHCLYIACLANWTSWTCAHCRVRASKAGNGELDKQL